LFAGIFDSGTPEVPPRIVSRPRFCIAVVSHYAADNPLIDHTEEIAAAPVSSRLYITEPSLLWVGHNAKPRLSDLKAFAPDSLGNDSAWARPNGRIAAR
jgi:hypothetical protein